jgi:prophage regulatory protein
MDAGRSVSPSSPDDISFLRLPDVKLMSGLSKSSLYALIREGSFPAPVPLGLRMVGWVKSEVQRWAAERIENRRVLSTGSAARKRA